jgi:hypothetical protein
MSYWLRGGLGVFNPPSRPVMEDCIPFDVQCVDRNRIKGDVYEAAVNKAQADNNRDQCYANAANANTAEQRAAVMARCDAAYSGAEAYGGGSGPVNWGVPLGNPQPYTSSVAPIASATKGGQLSFTSSRGSTSLQVGDTWLAAITGASPNSPVTVSGSGNAGVFGATSMGSTDGNGNYSKSGQVGTGEVGSWSEQWAVGGVPSGSVSFTVSKAMTPQGGPVVPPLQTPAVPLTPGGGVVVPPSVGGFDFAKIPWWAWAGAAGVAFFAFGKGGR